MSDPSLLAVLDLMQSATLDLVRVAVPAIVDAFDPAAQSVDVRPVAKSGADPWPTVPDVPIQWLRSGGLELRFPIVAGDSGLLLLTGADLGAWRATGEPGAGLMTHGLTGGVFLPGLQRDALLTDATPRQGFIGSPQYAAIEIAWDGIAVTKTKLSPLRSPVVCSDPLVAILNPLRVAAGLGALTPAEIAALGSDVLSASYTPIPTP